MTSRASSSGFQTVPLPLALHLASYTVIGLFCMFAGLMNLIDPGHILRLGLPLLALTGFSWGYVFGVLMERKEAVIVGFLASTAYVGVGIWRIAADLPFALLLMAIGAYGLFALILYRKQLLG
jgi:hypothetical protein